MNFSNKKFSLTQDHKKIESIDSKASKHFNKRILNYLDFQISSEMFRPEHKLFLGVQRKLIKQILYAT